MHAIAQCRPACCGNPICIYLYTKRLRNERFQLSTVLSRLLSCLQSNRIRLYYKFLPTLVYFSWYACNVPTRIVTNSICTHKCNLATDWFPLLMVIVMEDFHNWPFLSILPRMHWKNLVICRLIITHENVVRSIYSTVAQLWWDAAYNLVTDFKRPSTLIWQLDQPVDPTITMCRLPSIDLQWPTI